MMEHEQLFLVSLLTFNPHSDQLVASHLSKKLQKGLFSQVYLGQNVILDELCLYHWASIFC